MGQLACGGLADGDQVFSAFRSSTVRVTLNSSHLWISFPWATEAWMSIGKSIPDYRQSKVDGTLVHDRTDENRLGRNWPVLVPPVPSSNATNH